MRQIPAKSPRLRLDAASYRELHQQLLERGGWRCQTCGSMHNLQVHHLRFRSQAGGDVQQNLITLCAECHAGIHTLASSALCRCDTKRSPPLPGLASLPTQGPGTGGQK
jgi:5-methylcytosine-specific restriction endonuclease McrA